jgi:hypothetical protein
MALLDFQTALGRLVRAPTSDDPFRLLHLSPSERAWFGNLIQSAGYQFTVGVQRSWCIGRAARAAHLTLTILPDNLRRRLLDEWTKSGGGTSSFFAAEADALLDFIGNHLPDPSHELTVCRMEQATLRANEKVGSFTAPDLARLDDPDSVVRRGRHAGIAIFHGEPDRILHALLEHSPPPPLSPDVRGILFGPGLEKLCRPASVNELALWNRLANPVDVAALFQGGHKKEDVAEMLTAGAAEYVDGISGNS